MAKTHQVLTRPAPGTVIAPVHTHDEEQKAKIQALLEVSEQSCEDMEIKHRDVCSMRKLSCCPSRIRTASGSSVGWTGRTRYLAICALLSGI